MSSSQSDAIRQERFDIPSTCLDGCVGREFWSIAEEDTHISMTGHMVGWHLPAPSDEESR